VGMSDCTQDTPDFIHNFTKPCNQLLASRDFCSTACRQYPACTTVVISHLRPEIEIWQLRACIVKNAENHPEQFPNLAMLASYIPEICDIKIFRPEIEKLGIAQ